YFGTMIATVFSKAFPVGAAWHFTGQLLVVPAMTASLVAIVNVPMAAILFVVEVFGASYMVPALIVLVVTAIFTHQTSIYRTQRERYRRRQILPGYSVRRVVVPHKWHNKTLVQLQIRNHFGLNVIGWVEKEADDGLPHVRLSADANRPLNARDILVVIGKDEDLNEFEEEVAKKEAEVS
ncbi:MAG: hypothetical protein KDE51_21975, partial [Anaerolineales bacterium]|nr:hypothetical protein [Anaerolineales bacterium]